MTAVKPPHPAGWACCDPAHDLAGWIDRERARIAIVWRWARVLSARGQRIRRESIRATAAGDYSRADRLAMAADRTSRLAWVAATDAGISGGHVDRVEEAHQDRLRRDRAARLQGVA